MKFSTFERNAIVAPLYFVCAVPKYGQRACYNKSLPLPVWERSGELEQRNIHGNYRADAETSDTEATQDHLQFHIDSAQMTGRPRGFIPLGLFLY